MSEHALSSALEEVAQLWLNLLTMTGGKLNLSKCLAYVLITDFDSSGNPHFRTKEDLQASIQLTSETDNIATEITIYDPSQSHKTLGCMLNPNFDMTAQEQKLLDKATKYNGVFRTLALRGKKWQVRSTYDLVYLPAVTYPLSVSTFGCTALRRIQAVTERTILHGLQINSCFPLAVRYASSRYFGLDIHRLEVTQFTQQVLLLLSHIRQGSDIGHAYTSTINAMQIICGVSWPILRFPGRKLPMIDNKYFTLLRAMLHQTGMHLELPLWTPQLCRSEDSMLMDRVTENCTTAEIKQVNQCRVYLQVLSLSDISMPDGKSLHPKFHCSQYRDDSWNPGLDWPVQANPPQKAWTTWRRVIRRLFCR